MRMLSSCTFARPHLSKPVNLYWSASGPFMRISTLSSVRLTGSIVTRLRNDTYTKASQPNRSTLMSTAASRPAVSIICVAPRRICMGAMPFPETCNPCQHASCQVCQLLRLCGTAAKARQSFAAHLPFCEAEDGRQPCEEALGVSGDFRGLDLLWVELWRIRLGRPQVARPWQHAEEREGEEDAETDKKVHDDGRDNG